MQIENLMADSQLVELCELQRVGDEVLDVVSLNENQHSDILAWMLDSREGHGQGDDILRDLLVFASTAAHNQKELKGSETARFFKEWPVSRIRTTSFGAAFTARELGIKAAERVDLFIIDTQNRFVLIIENKSRGVQNALQLRTYRKEFNALAARNARLKKYDCAFLAIDLRFDADAAASSNAKLAESKTWLHLGYDWLKTSAVRATLHVERGNSAAQLVVSYCNRQTDWEDPSGKKAADIAFQLHQRYRDEIKYFLEFSEARLETKWLNAPDDDAALLFLLQNKGVVALLKKTRGMAAVEAAIKTALPKLPSDSIEVAQKTLDLCPRGWEDFDKDFWPLNLHVKSLDDAADTRYRLELWCYTNRLADEALAQDLRKRLVRVDPRCGTSEKSGRKVVLEERATFKKLVELVVDIEAKLAAALN